MKEQVESLTSNDRMHESRLDTLALRGTWCAYKEGKTNTEGRLRYDQLTFVDSNLQTGLPTPLNIDTGI